VRRVLLDTHTLLWWLMDAPALGLRARALIAEPRHAVYVSAASAWEIAIKRNLGKLVAPDDVSEWIENTGFQSLPISIFHACSAGSLRWDHRDPFDRMLVAQAQIEGLELLTADAHILAFGIRTVNASK